MSGLTAVLSSFMMASSNCCSSFLLTKYVWCNLNSLTTSEYTSLSTTMTCSEAQIIPLSKVLEPMISLTARLVCAVFSI